MIKIGKLYVHTYKHVPIGIQYMLFMIQIRKQRVEQGTCIYISQIPFLASAEITQLEDHKDFDGKTGQNVAGLIPLRATIFLQRCSPVSTHFTFDTNSQND